jgi:NHLM bacteriocin system ABC transporter ATP-binding protein
MSTGLTDSGTPGAAAGESPGPALLHAAGDRPLVLNADGAWLVATGRIDVFATRLDSAGEPGPRTHLFRVKAGGVLLGSAPAAGMVLLGVGAPGTTVSPVEGGVAGAVARRTAEPRQAAAALDLWVRRVYGVLVAGARVPRHQGLEPGAELQVEAGACVRPVPVVGWLQQSSGASLLLGRDTASLREGALIPVTRQAWVTASSAGALRLWTTDELLRGDPAPLCQGLATLHEVLLSVVGERLAGEDGAHRERIRRRGTAARAAMGSVLTRLAATLYAPSPDQVLRAVERDEVERETDSLFPVFRLVASARGIELPELAAQAALGGGDPVPMLARAHRLRTRRVVLRDGWWTQDGEPLVARLADRPRAVALLPDRSGWLLVDPFARTQTRVDAETAATLTPFGYAVYRPFGPGAVGAWSLLRFGLHGCRRDLSTVGLMGAAVALLGLVTPLAVGLLYNSIIPGAQRGQLVQLTLALLLCALAVAAFETVRGFALLRLESRMGPGLQAAVWDRLLSLPLPFFRDYTAGDLAVRAMGVDEMRSIASGTVLTLVLSGVLSLTNFVLLFTYDPRLAWWAAGLIAMALAVSVVLSWLQVRRQRIILPLRSRTAGVVLQLLSGLPKLKTAGAEVYGFALWARLFGEQRRHQFRARTLRIMQMVFASAFPVLSTLVLFHAAAAPALAQEGTAAAAAVSLLGTGDLLAFMAAFHLALAAMLASSNALVGALDVVPLYEQLRPILQAAPEVHVGTREPGELTGNIELQGVTFRYRADGPPVLQNVSLRVQPGEFVALVGPSGSGKSTLLRLLLGFEAPESGVVTYDQQDLRGLDPEAVRRQIGVVTQSGRLMSGDIFSNIAGSSSATVDEAWEAARMAGLDEDIRQMPMGMHTVISDGGAAFSGGQRQRLMIARALLRRPSVLFFDEATSALDNRTQEIVSHSLERLKATRIVVAHRLSTIRNADRIHVLQSGSIVETGSYDELMALDGVFAQLARRQLV